MNVRIEHLAIWAEDLEKMKAFYCRWLGAEAGEKYENPRKQFTSYFLSFAGGARLELMHRPELSAGGDREQQWGIAHLAFSLGSREAVDSLTEALRAEGCTIAGEPRVTGDGYYESVLLDPEGNRIELTV